MIRRAAWLLLLAVPVAAFAETTAIVNMSVIPMTSERVVGGQTVLIEDGIIRLVDDFRDVAVPEGATLVDGTDRFLMPGFTEMHAHVSGTSDAAIDRLFSLFLAGGVTTVRGMLGRPAHLVLREDLEQGRVTGPRLVTSGPSLNGNSVRGPADGERQVREQYAAGYDFIKIHPGLDALEFAAIADTANELGMPFAGHVPVSVGVEGALARGMATIDHLDGYIAALLPANVDTSGGYGGFFDVLLADEVEEEKIAAVVAATVAAGVANVPTETLFEQLVSAVPPEEIASRAEMRYVDRETVNDWVQRKRQLVAERGYSEDTAERAIRIRRRLIREIHRAGGELLLGSDAPQVFNVPGFSLHRELALMVAAGLTPYEALQTATVAPAGFLGVDSGTVEPGRLADLVLLDASPLDSIDNSRRIHGVLIRGKWFRSSYLLDRANGADRGR